MHIIRAGYIGTMRYTELKELLENTAPDFIAMQFDSCEEEEIHLDIDSANSKYPDNVIVKTLLEEEYITQDDLKSIKENNVDTLIFF